MNGWLLFHWFFVSIWNLKFEIIIRCFFCWRISLAIIEFKCRPQLGVIFSDKRIWNEPLWNVFACDKIADAQKNKIKLFKSNGIQFVNSESLFCYLWIWMRNILLNTEKKAQTNFFQSDSVRLVFFKWKPIEIMVQLCIWIVKIQITVWLSKLNIEYTHRRSKWQTKTKHQIW